MKTWVAFILIVMVFGMAVGFIASIFDKDDDSESTEPSGTTIIQTDEGPGEEISLQEAASGRLAKSKIGQMMRQYGITKEQVVDLAISAVFLLILATNILNAQNSSKIFMPADVPMLFSSPLKPQSVLMLNPSGLSFMT